ncbi:DUF1543 domain-containing protein [Acinetobacter gerneri]|uniref:DUF1543 domain-containing protein n=1 Tax=Acinetobacter gerneri TaxID=202952 RepID=UPI0029365481|nr:DUF1543 domain-containing protein [Acinetobacter gerneri]MDV2438832.1 DUF1543 domain-containing protein [Acinetobacter gerneri]
MPSLFVVMLGGRHAKANTEVHDVVLAVGNSLEEVYPQLKQAWFAEQKGLHIDAWAQIQGVEFEAKKYQLHFTEAMPNPSEQKLYLINLGGYDPKEFGELHRYVLVVAQNEMVAKEKGKQFYAQGWYKAHTDRVLEVDDCIAVDQVYGHFVQLVEGEFAENIWENTYLTIG